jgi:hypothetical protein
MPRFAVGASMDRARRSSRLLLLAVLSALAVGCGLVHRPYANDPILRERSPVWGDPGRARSTDFTTLGEPVPPLPPKPASELPRELLIVAE